MPFRRKQQDDAEQGPAGYSSMIKALEALRDSLLASERQFDSVTSEVHAAYETSARNLLHYMALRQHDRRELQEGLAMLGFSSLGRSESHVMANLNAVLKVLHRLTEAAWRPPSSMKRIVSYHEGMRMLETHTEVLLGKLPKRRRVRIMVTLPGETADDYAQIRDLVKGGMNCARINCAHEGPDEWERMVRNIRKAERELAKPCRILMDLAGPKLRTGALEPGPRIVKWRPKRGADGKVLAPACLRLSLVQIALPTPGATPANGLLNLPMERLDMAGLTEGDCLEFLDAREKKRLLKITRIEADGLLAESEQTAYIAPGLCIGPKDFLKQEKPTPLGVFGDLPPVEAPISLSYGDTLILTAAQDPGRPAIRDKNGKDTSPAFIPCTLPEIFPDLKAKERIWLDDGKIGGVIEEVTPERVKVRIVRAKEGGEKLRADKGINLPDSELRLHGLTPQDKENLHFITQHADMVALSFVRSPEDVLELHAALKKLGARNLGVVLKIETRKALENIPAILLAAMRLYPIGLMIARGDLAVECGFERLAEAQEELLWVCEAAHVPVIWATQVLENLTKQGLPSRAEITDAAMSVRAECVMLNKGPFILESLRVLDDILCRMETHTHKKTSLLGRLDVGGLGKK